MPDKVVTRFAPSPTGFLHIGAARTAIFAYLYARQQSGEFILRIEDTDKSREVEGAIAHIQESLRWLGLDWDHGPDKPGSFGSCIQSERIDTYTKYAQQLIEKGLAYPDPHTAEEIAAFKAEAESRKQPFLIRNHRPATFDTWDGSKPLRLKVPEIKRYTWQDAVRGELSAGEEMLDDIIIIKADGYPTYNFAHIIDDLEMGVTHVMRGDEFISSMPKFLSIYDALEIPYPVFVTLPPIMREDRTKKLSKRDGAKDLLQYREEGYLPEALLNFLALIGWNPGGEDEIFTKSELVERFSFDHIQKGGGAFNEEKLQWMNRQHLNLVTTETYLEELTKRLSSTVTEQPEFSTDRLTRILPTIRERAATYHEAADMLGSDEFAFLFSQPDVDPAMAMWKEDTSPADTLPRLEKLQELLSMADFSTPETVKAAVWDYAEEVGRGAVLWPFRVSLTGQQRSPDPFTVAHVLGKAHTLDRLAALCAKIKL